MNIVRFQPGQNTSLARTAFEAGRAAGEKFQQRCCRTGGRQRELPKPPYEDEALNAAWQSGFDYETESVGLETAGTGRCRSGHERANAENGSG